MADMGRTCAFHVAAQQSVVRHEVDLVTEESWDPSSANFRHPDASARLRTVGWGKTVDRPFHAYVGENPYVFACYSHADKALVYPELQWLYEAGVNVWYDEGISPGSEWTEELASHIEKCAVFSFFVTPSSVASEHCRRELNFALDQRCKILAIHLERTELPSGLKLVLSNRQAILAYEYASGDYRTRLVSAISSGLRPHASAAPGAEPASTSTGDAQPTKRNSSDQPSSRLAIAVLPFENLSNDTDQDYFSDGISEDILDALARNRSLTVRARQSSFLFKGQHIDPQRVARDLSVSYLISGTVRAHRNRIRVTARLMDVNGNTDIWSDRYDREIDDIFAVQDEVTTSIVKALGLRLSRVTRGAGDIEAYKAYLMGRDYQHHQDLARAIESFSAAIRINPNYADAYAALGQVYASLIGFSSSSDLDALVSKEREFVAKALQHDPRQPLALGLSALRLTAQPAIDQLHKLITQYPSDLDLHLFYSFLMRRIGRFDLSSKLCNRVVALDPLSEHSVWQRANDHVMTGNLAAALADCDRAEELGISAALIRAQVAVVRQDFLALRDQCSRPPTDWQATPAWRTISLAAEPFLNGDYGRVQSILSDLGENRDRLTPFTRFVIALLMRDDDAAATIFEYALEQGEFTSLLAVQGTAAYRTLFPNFYSSDRYFEILRRFELDKDSLTKITVQPFPFDQVE